MGGGFYVEPSFPRAKARTVQLRIAPCPMLPNLKQSNLDVPTASMCKCNDQTTRIHEKNPMGHFPLSSGEEFVDPLFYSASVVINIIYLHSE